MISLEVSLTPDSEWNNRLLQSPTGTIYQTKELALYYEELVSWDHKYIKFINQKNEIVGQIMLLFYPRFSKKGRVGNILKRIPKSKSIICKWHYGPVIFNLDFMIEIRKEFAQFLQKNNYKVIGSEHPLSNGIFFDVGKPFKLSNWGTFLIDLSQSKEDLWQKLNKHSARKNVERSLKKDVYIKELNNSNIRTFYELIKNTKAKLGINIDFRDPLTLYEKTHKIGFTGFIAYHNEIPLGSIGVSYFNSYINEWGVGRSDIDSQEKFYAQDLLKWKIIEWGKNHGHKYYDLTGVNPNSKGEKEMGIFRYKKKWGGKLFIYNNIKL